MNFSLTEDQLMLQDALQRLVADEYSFEQRNKVLSTAHGFNAATWQQLAEQGVLGLGLPEIHGGLGGQVEIMVAMEQFGRGLVLEPFLSTVVLAGGLIAELGTTEQQAALLPRTIAGEQRFAFAHYESGTRYNLGRVNTMAREVSGGYSLLGTKVVVLDAAVANFLIVSACHEASTSISLFIIDVNAPGVELISYRTQDGRNAADIKLHDVKVSKAQLLGKAGTALPAIEKAIDRSTAALCAEATGIIEALNAATLEYLKTRQQFGQPIGRFQALQHRMADMFVMAVQARSMSVLANGHCNSSDASARRRSVSAAKAFIGKAARFVGQQAVQLHGGMGISAELIVSHYFKRLTMINATFGDAEHHLAVVSDDLLRARA